MILTLSDRPTSRTHDLFRPSEASLGSDFHQVQIQGRVMATDGEPKSLSEITKDMGLNMSDVAAFSGLDESTIFRLWDNAEWLDRVSGRSLQSLMSSVPGIAEYSMAHAVRKRRDSLVADLHSEGLSVNLATFENS